MSAAAILVLCATGRQGTAVVRALSNLPKPPMILAVTRSVSSPGAQKLASTYPSVKLVQGNLDDVPSLFTAAQKASGGHISGVFSVQLPQGMGSDNEVKQGKAVIEASLAHGVNHFVYSSVDRGGNERSWSNPTNVPHVASKHAVELDLRDKAQGSDMTWTILRPVAFMDNLAPGMQSSIFLAALKLTLAPQQPLQWVAVRDIGVFAANAFEEPEAFNGKAIGLAGDETTVDQVTRTFSASSVEGLKPSFSILGNALKLFVTELRLMINWFGSEGYGVDIGALRKMYPGLTDLKTWIIEESEFTAKP